MSCMSCPDRINSSWFLCARIFDACTVVQHLQLDDYSEGFKLTRSKMSAEQFRRYWMLRRWFWTRALYISSDDMKFSSRDVWLEIPNAFCQRHPCDCPISIEMSRIAEHFSIFFRSASSRCTSEKDMEKSSLRERPIRDKSDLSSLKPRNIISERQ
jgi:hypothetical protein